MLGVLIRASEIGRERAIALARCVHGVVVDLQSSSRRSSSSSSRRSSSSSNRNTVEEPHVFDEHNTIVGIYTPVTKRLWQQRYQWDKQRLAAAQPQTEFLPKPPTPIDVRYPFAKDPVLREHYRNPWSGVRLGRILEDMDSLAGFVAYSHSMDDSQSTRPPLLVTATVEKISFREASLSLKEDMRMTGKVIWTGKSSMDIQMELHRGSSPSSPSIIALFTFVARDPVTGRSHKVNPLSPQTEEEKQVFNTRQKVADGRKAARELTKSSGQLWTASQLDWAKALLDESRKKRDLPALANPTALFMHDTMLENTFTTQPQQRNIHGRIFGGFLMRRAFELAHSTAYLLGACRPRTVLIDEIQFKRPVEVGDLLRFRSWVLSAKATPKVEEPDRALVHVQVQAAVTKPEALESYETNTFNFLFAIKQRKAEPDGEDYLPMPTMLPGNEEEALQMCLFYGPESRERWGESEFNDQGSVR